MKLERLHTRVENRAAKVDLENNMPENDLKKDTGKKPISNLEITPHNNKQQGDTPTINREEIT